MDGLLSNVPSILGGILNSRTATAAAAGLLGAAYLDSKLSLSRDIKTISRGRRALAKLDELAVKTGKFNISYRWDESVSSFGNNVAFRTPEIEPEDTGRTWTYKQADEYINKIAKWLKEELGVGYGDRVALVFENSCQYLMVVLACQKLGAVHVPQVSRILRSIV
jgi:hypothetical protein